MFVRDMPRLQAFELVGKTKQGADYNALFPISAQRDNMSAKRDTPQLTPEEFKFVTEILNGSTVEEAGESVGVKRRTAFTWKQKEHIKAAIAAGARGQIKVVEEFQAERVRIVLPEVSKVLEEKTLRAIHIIVDIMEAGTKDDLVRLQAAKEIVKLSGVVETQKVTQNTEQSVQQKGLTPEAADAIRAQILGINTKT